jgi:flagellar biosynthetic protein FliQ
VNEGDAIDLVQLAIWMVVVGAGPCVGAAMSVGVVIAFQQALTQIQEMTLTFVPKMIAVFVAAGLTASFVGGKFSIFTESTTRGLSRGTDRRPESICRPSLRAKGALRSPGLLRRDSPSTDGRLSTPYGSSQ